MVSVLDTGVEGPGFKSQPHRCLVTVLGKLFTPIVPLTGCEGSCRPGGKYWQPAARFDSRHLQADCREPGSAREPYARQSSMGYLYLFAPLPCLQCSYLSHISGCDCCRRRPTWKILTLGGGKSSRTTSWRRSTCVGRNWRSWTRPRKLRWSASTTR